ncbi:MAG: cardiolipin synthase [Pirellulales bacterium]
MNALGDLFSRIDWSPSWWDILGLVSYALAILSVPSVLLQRRASPYAALSWILVLFSIPLLGIFLWWALGRRHLFRKRRRRRVAAAHVSASMAQLREELPAPPLAESPLLALRNLPEEDAQWDFPPTAGNRVALMADGPTVYEPIEAAMQRARHHVHLLFYIWHNDVIGRRLRDELIERVRAGVQVRVLCDGFGAPEVSGRFMDPLREAGGKVGVFLPPRFFSRQPQLNFRNHRKIVVVDGALGFIGGFNIGDEYMKDWHDTAIGMTGPVVDQLQEVFADDWYFATGEDIMTAQHFGRWRDLPQELSLHNADGTEPPPDAQCDVVASGPHTPQNSAHDVIFVAITQAVRRVWIMTPYFIPDSDMLTALRTAVYRGVDVRVLLPEKIDQPIARLAARSYYEVLLQAGVKIYEYLPGVLHGKTMLFDDELSLVGSANMDIRSFKLNFEISCLVLSRSLAGQLAALFEKDLGQSREITLADMENRSRWAKLVESAAHLLSPMI